MPEVWETNPLTLKNVVLVKSNKKFLEVLKEIYKEYKFEWKTGREILDFIITDKKIYSDGNHFRRVMKGGFEQGFFQRATYSGQGYLWRLNPEIEKYKNELKL